MIKRSLGLQIAAATASFAAFGGAAYEVGQTTAEHGDTYNYNIVIDNLPNQPNLDALGKPARIASYAGTCSVIGSGVKGDQLWVQISTRPYGDQSIYGSQMPDIYTARSITLADAMDNPYGVETVPATPLPKGGPLSADTEATFNLPLPGTDPANEINLVSLTAHTNAGDVSCGSPQPDVAGLYLLTEQGIAPIDGQA